ncbi:hypothetical protein E2C01_038570 [Portunus trituberculatus]|uniref:Uncharacterized protein n=1 Tax=Portunus trituberculatus TaxID=210409 RepID=A0A5B7FIA2_PORTR|nr:hypothetical protein [Portunus trituberculatus]
MKRVQVADASRVSCPKQHQRSVQEHYSRVCGVFSAGVSERHQWGVLACWRGDEVTWAGRGVSVSLASIIPYCPHTSPLQRFLTTTITSTTITTTTTTAATATHRLAPSSCRHHSSPP